MANPFNVAVPNVAQALLGFQRARQLGEDRKNTAANREIALERLGLLKSGQELRREEVTENRAFRTSEAERAQANTDRSLGLRERELAASRAERRRAKPPSGFRFTQTGDLEAIPGGPASGKAEERERQKRQRQAQKATAGKVVVDDIDRAISIVEKAAEPGIGNIGGIINPTTGVAGQVLSNIGGTDARDVEALVTTIKANAGFDRLQAMREASPTGGALGQVSNLELGQLNAAIGNLDQSQSQGQFTDNMRRVKNIYLDIIHGPGNGPRRAKLKFKNPTQPTEGPALTPNNPVISPAEASNDIRGIPQVNTPQEAAALPSGTQFRDPDGILRRVP